MPKPFVIAVTAFPSTGKTVTANYLSRTMGLEVLSSSDIRRDFGWAGHGTIHASSDAAEVEHALQGHSKLAYDVLALTLKNRLRQGLPVLVEGTFNTHRHRALLYRLVEEGWASELVLVRCECARAQAHDRMKHRRTLKSLGFNHNREVLDQGIYERYRATYERVDRDDELAAANVTLLKYFTDQQVLRMVKQAATPTATTVVHDLLTSLARTVSGQQQAPAVALQAAAPSERWIA